MTWRDQRWFFGLAVDLGGAGFDRALCVAMMKSPVMMCQQFRKPRTRAGGYKGRLPLR
ncbi:hypothetical protein [Ralstonia sp. GP101]|uniref:hypothetical protein n=1 Tax=Ralstonia sp. GP101 TaxID=3035146 RepID=UPI003892B873